MNKPIQPEYFTRYPATDTTWDAAYSDILDNAEAYAADIADHSDALETLAEILRIYHSADEAKQERMREIADKLDDLTDSYARHMAEREADRG